MGAGWSGWPDHSGETPGSSRRAGHRIARRIVHFVNHTARTAWNGRSHPGLASHDPRPDGRSWSGVGAPRRAVGSGEHAPPSTSALGRDRQPQWVHRWSRRCSRLLVTPERQPSRTRRAPAVDRPGSQANSPAGRHMAHWLTSRRRWEMRGRSSNCHTSVLVGCSM